MMTKRLLLTLTAGLVLISGTLFAQNTTTTTKGQQASSVKYFLNSEWQEYRHVFYDEFTKEEIMKLHSSYYQVTYGANGSVQKYEQLSKDNKVLSTIDRGQILAAYHLYRIQKKDNSVYAVQFFKYKYHNYSSNKADYAVELDHNDILVNMFYVEVTYNSNNRVMKDELYDEKLDKHQMVYTYDQKGNLSSVEYYLNDFIEEVWDYKYNDKNQVTSLLKYAGIERERTLSWRYKYDKTGNILKADLYDKGLLKRTWEYTSVAHDGKMSVSEIIEKDIYGRIHSSMGINSIGQLVKKEMYGFDGKVLSTTSFPSYIPEPKKDEKGKSGSSK